MRRTNEVYACGLMNCPLGSRTSTAMTVERAIKLTEYFKESALNVQNVLNENTLNSQQQTIVNLLPPSFTTAQAIQIAEQNGMKERTFQRFLNDNIGTLFRKEKHGEYSKINP